ncbi:putative helicase mov-10-B.1 isoform X2 [Epargyreus clarus]|uniref:putative helicase mov-10-B.1 isoform X2 n=1 Tax=Epargyreus clarus TaxID=520877 RepID=UPI003C2EB19E
MENNLNEWSIPLKYKKIYSKGLDGKHIVTAEEHKYVMKLKVIFNNLSDIAYEAYFHHLLWFEETKEREMLHEQDVDRVILKEEGKKLSIAVPKIKQKRVRIDDRIMLVSNLGSSKKLIGIITDIKQNKLIIELEKPKSYRTKIDEVFKLVFLYSEYQSKSMHNVINDIMKHTHRSKIYPKKNITPPLRTSIIKWYNPSIARNSEQRAAVEHIVAKSSGTAPYVLHGPPGTGKTATIVEAILQVLKSNESNRVMVCAPSNMAADDVAVKLLKYESEFPSGIFLLRRNSASRDWSTLPGCLKSYSTDPFVRNPSIPYVKQLEAALKGTRVIVSTICYGPQAARNICNITHLFIDEAGQATEPLCLLPIRKVLVPTGLLVLSGDPLQLGPVICSPHAKKHGLGLSMMERLMKEYTLYNARNTDPSYTVMLKKNFRSHADILSISNEQFYEGKLQACIAEESISRVNILNSTKKCRAIVFHAVFGQEQKENQSSSYFNKMELDMLKVYIRRLMVRYKQSLKDIGIITPYTSQVIKIKEWLSTQGAERIEVGSVESFQGKEKKIILISTVRGNGKDSTRKVKLGFLTDSKRFNVALTRAKAKLIVIGNPNCLNTDKMWRLYIRKCIEMGSYNDSDCMEHLRKQTHKLTSKSNIIRACEN